MLKTYVPLGHGKEITNESDYVIKQVPPNCFYITMAISGEQNRVVAHDIFFNMMNEKDTRNLFVDVLSNFHKIKSIFDKRIPDTFKDSIKLNLRLPGEDYVDVNYYLFLDFKESNNVFKAGLYDMSYIHTHYGDFNRNIRDTKLGKKIPKNSLAKIYEGSLLPTPDYFDNFIEEHYKSEKYIPNKNIKEILKFWPFYSNNFYTTGMFKIISTNPDGTVVNKPNSFHDLVVKFSSFINEHENNSFNINNDDDVFKNGPASVHSTDSDSERGFASQGPTILKEMVDLLNNSDPNSDFVKYVIKYYSFMIKLFKRIKNMAHEEEFDLNDKKLLEETLRSEGFHQEMRNLFQQYIDRRDKPIVHISQSYLFDNFPGIHINMACRSLPESFPRERMLARRRNSNVSRLRYNTNNMNPNLKKILNKLRPMLNEEDEEEEENSPATGGAGGNGNNRALRGLTRRKNRRFFGAGHRRKTHTK